MEKNRKKYTHLKQIKMAEPEVELSSSEKSEGLENEKFQKKEISRVHKVINFINNQKNSQGEQGRYVYCVGKTGKHIFNLGKIGLEKEEVYTLSTGELCAVVHNCQAEPYQSNEEKIVKEWIKTHQKVIDLAAKKLGTVIPFSFDVIIKGESPDEEVLNWLKTEEENLKRKINKIKGKQEFGVQVFFDKKLMLEKISEEDEEIKKLKKEIKEASKGRAYFQEQKIKDILKKEMEKKADFYFKKFYEEIKKHADDIKIEKVKQDYMLMNLSCLVYKEKVKELGLALDKINTPPFSLKFTGPWPAYSFV